MMTDQENSIETDIEALRRRDLITALFLILLSALIFIESCLLTFGLDIPIATAPGIVPLVLSGGMIAMLIGVLVVSLRQGRFEGALASGAVKQFFSQGPVQAKIIQSALLMIYVFLMLGRLHFWLASALYLFAAMALSRNSTLWMSAVIALGVSGAIYGLFGLVMKVPLP